MLLPVSFLVRPQDRFFVPTCAGAMTPRAGAVKAGRRSWGVAGSGLDRPRLDGAEHGVMLGRVGTAAIGAPEQGIEHKRLKCLHNQPRHRRKEATGP